MLYLTPEQAEAQRPRAVPQSVIDEIREGNRAVDAASIKKALGDVQKSITPERKRAVQSERDRLKGECAALSKKIESAFGYEKNKFGLDYAEAYAKLEELETILTIIG
jgi:hypothetical protein